MGGLIWSEGPTVGHPAFEILLKLQPCSSPGSPVATDRAVRWQWADEAGHAVVVEAFAGQASGLGVGGGIGEGSVGAQPCGGRGFLRCHLPGGVHQVLVVVVLGGAVGIGGVIGLLVRGRLAVAVIAVQRCRVVAVETRAVVELCSVAA